MQQLRAELAATRAENARDSARVAELEQDLQTVLQQQRGAAGSGGGGGVTTARAPPPPPGRAAPAEPLSPGSEAVAGHKLSLYEAQISDLLADREGHEDKVGARVSQSRRSMAASFYR